MSHIFGLAHSFSGIVDQASNILGLTQQVGPPINQFAVGSGSSASVIDDVFGDGVGSGGGMVSTGGACGPCGPKTKRYITTVCPDGSTTIREAKSRKRKRRLATVSDIKDLAALKTILGGGKSLDNWIATRGR